jgi:uncharacterized membrane protein
MVLPGDSEWNRGAIRRALSGGYHTVVGAFSSAAGAERALIALNNAAFTGEEVSLVANGSDAADEILSQASAQQTVEGTTKGAIAGGVLGGLVAVGALVIPGAAPFAVAGLLAAWLEGMFAGAFFGGIAGALIEHGVPEDVARRYEKQMSDGDYLMMVLAKQGHREATARQILQEAGSEDVETYPYQVRPEQFPGHETQLEAQARQAAAGEPVSPPASANIRPGMMVISSDGEIVGRVKQARRSEFLLDRELQTDLYVPIDAVRNVIGDEVILNVPRYEVSRLKERTAPGKPETEGWKTPPLG